MEYFTEQEYQIITELYPTHSVEFIANLLGRTPSEVRNKASNSGLKKQNKTFSIDITFEERASLVLSGFNKCTKCKEVKPLNRFESESSMNLGYKNQCKDCTNLRIKENKFKKPPNTKCDICNKPIFAGNGQLKSRKRHFCSDECRRKWQSDKAKINNPNKPTYSKEQELEVITYIQQGMTISEIEDITNLTKHKIRHIINRNNLEYLGRNKYNSELHRKLLNILKVVFPDNKFVEEYYIKDTKQHIDIFDTTLNVAYEANGIQHYISKGTWNRNPEDFSKQQYRDFIKKEWCLKNNIPLIIIRYDEDLTSDLIISKLEKVLPKGGVAL